MDNYSIAHLNRYIRNRKIKKTGNNPNDDDPLKNLYGKAKQYPEYVGGKVERKITEGGGGFQEYVGGKVERKITEGGGGFQEYVGGKIVLKEDDNFKDYVGGKIEYKDSNTEKLYREWLKTGRVKTDDSDGLNNNTNGLIRDFVKRRKREQNRQ